MGDVVGGGGGVGFSGCGVAAGGGMLVGARLEKRVPRERKRGKGGVGGDLRDNVNALPCARLVTVFVFRAA